MSPFDPTVTYVDFKGYKVGSDGSVWTCKNNSGRLTDHWRPLKFRRNDKGYDLVTLCEGRKRKAYFVGRLVLTAFVRPPEPGEDACHRNHVRHDNRLENLFWDTHQNNIIQRDERDRRSRVEYEAPAERPTVDPPATCLYADYLGYKVGSDGSVWTCKDSKGRQTGHWRPMSPPRSRKGYLVVMLSDRGKYVLHAVSRLVLTLFVRPALPGEEACHKNDVRDDNRVENLHWDTHENNVRQRDERGRLLYGERQPNAKLRAIDIPSIFLMSALGFEGQDIAKDYGVSKQTIYMVLRGKRWRRAIDDAALEGGIINTCT